MPRLEKSKQPSLGEKPSETKEKHEPKKGSLLLAGILVVAGNLNWLFLAWILTTFQPVMWLLAALLFALYGALLIIATLLIPERKIATLAWFLSVLGIPVWFGIFWTSFLAIIIAFLAGLALIGRLILQMKNLARVKPWAVTRNGLELALMGLALAVSLSYFSELQRLNQNGTTTLDRIRTIGTNMIGNVLAWKVSGYDPLMTIDNLITELAKLASEEVAKKMTSGGIPEGPAGDQSIKFSDLPPEQQQEILDTQKAASQAAIEEELKKQFTDFFKQYNIQANGSTPVGQALDQLVGNTLVNTLGPFMIWLNHFMAFSLFIILLLLTPLLRFFIRIMTVVMLKLLKALHVVTVHTEKRDVEVMELR